MKVRMSVSMSPAVRAAVTAAGVRAYPLECCGILLGHANAGKPAITHAIVCENIADEAERHHRYLIDPKMLLRTERAAEAMGLEIAGFYHSHPDNPAAASATDLEQAWGGYVYVIVRVTKEGAQEMTGWTLDEENGRMGEIPIVVEG